MDSIEIEIKNISHANFDLSRIRYEEGCNYILTYLFRSCNIYHTDK